MKYKKVFSSPLLITLLLVIPAFLFLLKPVYYNMHDDMQMIRQLQLEKCLKDGQLPCRWSPDLGYEYGYPLFNFYPPLPYIVGQVFRTLGFSFVWSIKLTAITQFLFSSISMYLLVSYLSTPTTALIAALFYTYAPYRAVNVYVRGAMNEAWASVFFPLIFLFIKKVIDKPNKKNIIFLGLSITGLMLSHNPMLLVFGLFCIPWTLCCIYKNSKSIPYLLASFMLGLGLSSFYILPVLFETRLIHINAMFEGYFDYQAHFVSLYQLFISNFWGDGPSVWGTDDRMSFMVGYLHWIIPLIYTLFFIFKLKSKKTKVKKIDFINIFIISLALLSLFLTHSRSIFIWKLIPPIQKIQFSWRFLNLAIFFLSISTALSIHSFQTFINSKKINKLLLPLIVTFLILLNLRYFKPLAYGPLTDQDKFSGLAWQYQITSGLYDYLPMTASKAPLSKAKFVVDSIKPSDSAEIYGSKKGTDWLFFNANVFSNSQITIAQLYFPNFEITNHGQPIAFEVEPEFGRMVLNLTPGNYQIYAKLKDTPIRIISNIISLFSWTWLIFCLIYALKRSRKNKK